MCCTVHLNTLFKYKLVDEFKHFLLLISLRNEGNSGPFNGVINAFSLGTEKLMMNKEKKNENNSTNSSVSERKLSTAA
ncbi:hypothetical protein F7725_003444 [Dissostichus mawsoni]|uniref:Uncharacterized protein n=1 Tax=Dissostichus mawsoni TaxID=36200 RepID=A0A7J5YA84_DISMA|nr:hypothetical protein F7725_003444 [Dissostichus mawsoni]